ncbi:hypothetical protein [Streptomyces sp. NPDC005374]|uniref:hypothetical protein n=1 Tax=Streptomyces sp. NPDC005374 TaxID=3364713 RepID=UPI0036BE2CB2
MRPPLLPPRQEACPGHPAGADAAELEEIRSASAHLDATASRVREFADMMRDLRGEKPPAWRDRVLADGLPALHSLVNIPWYTA